jgi:hypothetical protein
MVWWSKFCSGSIASGLWFAMNCQKVYKLRNGIRYKFTKLQVFAIAGAII